MKIDLKTLIKEIVEETLYNKQIVSEETTLKSEDLSERKMTVGDGGLEFIQKELAEINKKATKWGVPPVELKIVAERMVPIPPKQNEPNPELSGNPRALRKQYDIVINGKSPKIDGYEFIAKIEHTDEGNIINIAPGASIKNLPEEYRSSNATCDICKSNRERFNTFVLRKEDDNDLIKAGSGCLKRFLPSRSLNIMIDYAMLLERLREAISVDPDSWEDYSGESREKGGPDRYRNHYSVEEIMAAVCTAYLIKGTYISRKAAQEHGSTSTSDHAMSILFPPRAYDDSHKAELEKERNIFQTSGKELAKKILDWSKTVDFASKSEQNPDFSNLYNNLKIISHSETANLKNMGYVAALLAMYNREMGFLKKKEDDANKKQSEFVGKVGEKIEFDGKLLHERQYDGQYGTVYIYGFEDKDGNKITWFSSNPIQMVKDGTYKVKGTVKDHKVSDPKYGSKKETFITRAKIVDSTGAKLNETDVVVNEEQGYKINPKEKKLISNAMGKFPELSGNKKYNREGGKSVALNVVATALDSVGFQLDMVTGDMIMGQKGNRLLTFKKKSEIEGQEGPTVSNSRINFAWENLSSDQFDPNYEILAYVT